MSLPPNSQPLADRLRPQTLSAYRGQTKLLGPGSFLRRAIENDAVPSLIFWGPPGVGKTTLARLIARSTHAEFIKISAVTSGKKELQTIIERATSGRRLGQKTLVFIDEIHRWNKAQQDYLLPFVKNGTITLIGATTENPSFEINAALLSRVRVFVLEKLTEAELGEIILAATTELKIKLAPTLIKLLARLANGDARAALNLLEAVISHSPKITEESIRRVAQKATLYFDKNGEEHYNLISALHKSLRGNDADAGLYWLARLLVGGEDPLYIARRLLRFTAEDVGLADVFALVLANSVFEACQKIGLPECKVHLAELVIYLAKAKKNIAAYEAYGLAERDADEYGNLPVPLPIRNVPTKLMKNLGYGKGYRYTPKENSDDQTYLPPELNGRRYCS